MTTVQNKAVVRAFIDAINAQAWTRLDVLMSPTVVRHGHVADQPDVRSREELAAFLCREAVAFPDAKEHVQALVGEGDVVAARLRFSGTQRGRWGSFPPSNKVLSSEFLAMFRIEDGRIAEIWVAWDNLDALVQLGHLTRDPPAAP